MHIAQVIIQKLNGTLQIFDLLKNAVLAGEPTDLGSYQNTTDATNNKRDFISGHEMAIVAFDKATNNFVIANPWGASCSGYFNGEFEGSMDQIWQGGDGDTELHIVH